MIWCAGCAQNCLEQWKWTSNVNYCAQLPPIIYSLENYQAFALVNFSTGQIFMGKGNTLNYIDILIALKKLIHLCQKPANDTQFWIVLSSCAVCPERALKAICFSLQFYYLEVLDLSRTPSGRSPRTHSFHQGAICYNWSSGLEVTWSQSPNRLQKYYIRD